MADCPDTGTCHHSCAPAGCWRVFGALPLSIHSEAGEWTEDEIKTERNKSIRFFRDARDRAEEAGLAMAKALDDMEKALRNGALHDA